jgi:Flp pilus assembly protein TadG
MVEFAFIAPVGFLLLLGIVVVAIIVTNFIQLTNEAREGARIAAICGAGSISKPAQMPDGSGDCTDAKIEAYITAHLVAVPGGSVNPTIYVCTPAQAASGGGCNATNGQPGIHNCYGQAGSIVQVDMSYDQPLYLPLVSSVFQTNPNGTRTLKASAQATCE